MEKKPSAPFLILQKDPFCISLDMKTYQATIEPQIENAKGDFVLRLWKMPGFSEVGEPIYSNMCAWLVGAGASMLDKLTGCGIRHPDEATEVIIEGLIAYQKIMTDMVMAKAVKTGIKGVYVVGSSPSEEEK